MIKKKVVIGLIGTVLDSGTSRKRWEKWRPTVSLGQFDDFLVDRFELLHTRDSNRLAICIEDDLKFVSPESELNRHTMDFDDPWEFEEVYSRLYDFAKNYPFDTDREEYYLHITTGTHVAQICLFLLSESRIIPGALLQTSPPTRNRMGDSGTYRIIDLDLSQYSNIHARFSRQVRSDVDFLKSGIATRNKRFNAMIDEIEHVAVRSKAPLLLLGPTGAGKSQLASRIYELKKNHNAVEGDFIEVNCATLRGDQAMAMIFGHTKGAFTGAVNARDGLMKKADQGILFLDEIGELSLDVQAMLLRALETGQFLPVGNDQESTSHFQLIVGTNQNLYQRVQEGKFRQDLLARINLWTFALPGLAERPEDIEPNIDFEMEQYAQSHGEQVRFARDAQKDFLAFATSSEAIWIGNFRDLNASITRMGTLSSGGVIDSSTVKKEMSRLRASWSALTESTPVKPKTKYHIVSEDQWQSLDLFDQIQLRQVLKVCKESRSLSDAGRKLFEKSRLQKQSSNDSDRLRKYLAKFGITWKNIERAQLL